jgi:hypothetical protein
MVFWLYGAVVALGPEKFGFCTTFWPRAVMVMRMLPPEESAPPARASDPGAVILVTCITTAVPFNAGPVALAVTVTTAPERAAV